MSKTVKKAIIIPLIIIITAGALFAYANFTKPSGERVSEILGGLIPDAQKYGEIIWGAGLPVKEGAPGKLETVTGAQYRPVDPDCGFASTGEMKEAFAKVFSSGYMQSISYGLFDGYDEMKISPRYKDIKGELNIDITNEGTSPEQIEYDLSSARSVGGGGNGIIAEIDGVTKDGQKITSEIKLVKENGVWLLDSPI